MLYHLLLKTVQECTTKELQKQFYTDREMTEMSHFSRWYHCIRHRWFPTVCHHNISFIVRHNWRIMLSILILVLHISDNTNVLANEPS